MLTLELKSKDKYNQAHEEWGGGEMQSPGKLPQTYFSDHYQSSVMLNINKAKIQFMK